MREHMLEVILGSMLLSIGGVFISHGDVAYWLPLVGILLTLFGWIGVFNAYLSNTKKDYYR